jgi:hypothetical protein
VPHPIHTDAGQADGLPGKEYRSLIIVVVPGMGIIIGVVVVVSMVGVVSMVIPRVVRMGFLAIASAQYRPGRKGGNRYQLHEIASHISSSLDDVNLMSGQILKVGSK